MRSPHGWVAHIIHCNNTVYDNFSLGSVICAAVSTCCVTYINIYELEKFLLYLIAIQIPINGRPADDPGIHPMVTFSLEMLWRAIIQCYGTNLWCLYYISQPNLSDMHLSWLADTATLSVLLLQPR